MHPSRLLTLAIFFCTALAGAQGVQGQEGEARVSGRVLLEDGSPAVGARLELVTQVSLPDGSGRKTRSSGEVKPDSSGAFSIAFDPCLDFDCTLTANLRGYLALEWTWDEVPAGGVKALPDRRFDGGLYVTGSIVDAEGNLLIEGWRVTVTPSGIDNFRAVGRTRFVPDPVTGIFRVGPLTPGELKLQAVGDHGLNTDTAVIQVQAGEPAHVLLRQASTSALQSIFVKVLPAKCSGLGLKGPFARGLGVENRTYMFLVDRNGAVLAEALWLMPKTSGTWWFTGVAPAEYSLELRHPLFEPLRVDGVSPGMMKQIQLVGSAVLEVRVLSPDGNPVPDCKAEVRYVDGRTTRKTYPLLPSGLTQTSAQRFQGVVPGRLVLFVTTPKGQRLREDLGLIIAGETRRVDVPIAPNQPLEVQVIDHEGRPVEGVPLVCALAGEMSKTPGGALPQTDASGRCVIQNAMPGSWRIFAEPAPYGKAHQEVEHPVPGGGPVVLELSGLGSFGGQLRCHAGFDFSAVELEMRLDDNTNHLLWRAAHLEELKVNSEGRFHLTDLPVGGAQLALWHDGFPRGGRITGKGLIHLEARITEGEQEWELDLEPLLRASCGVRLFLDGEAQIGIRVALLNEVAMGAITSADSPVQPPSSMVPVDEYGYARVRDLDPGALHTVVAIDPVDKWAVPVGQVRTKAYGDDARIECSVELVEREVLVRSAEGKPLPNVALGWACQGMSPAGAWRTTDSEGKFMLRMPPGIYSLFRAGQDRPSPVSFVWEAGDGPLAIDLRTGE